MPLTSPDNIDYPAGTSTTAWKTLMATMATSVQAALAKRPYKWADATARLAATGMSEGDTGDQADTEQRYRYNGTAWVNITTGLFPVIPTSVAGTGVTVGASGKVTAAAATSISVNGCFDSTYDNYKIIVDLLNGSTSALSFVLRVAGTNSTASYYRTQTRGIGVASSTIQSLNTAGWEIASVSLIGRQFAEITLARVAKAEVTDGFITSSSTTVPMAATAGVALASIQHNVSTAYDGFTLTQSAGSVTGGVWVYGYNNN